MSSARVSSAKCPASCPQAVYSERTDCHQDANYFRLPSYPLTFDNESRVRGLGLRNRVEFGDYRKFSSESTLSIGLGKLVFCAG